MPLMINRGVAQQDLFKGGFIAESFSFWLKSPKKAPNHSPESSPKKKMFSNLAPFFGDLSQSEKLSEIKPPLARVLCQKTKKGYKTFLSLLPHDDGHFLGNSVATYRHFIFHKTFHSFSFLLTIVKTVSSWNR